MDMSCWAPLSSVLQFNRIDAELALYLNSITRGVPARNLFTIVAPNAVNVVDLPNSFCYCEIGHVDAMGRISPFLIESNPTMDKEKESERISKKIEKGDIMSVNNWAVLIPKTRAYLGKYALINGSENSFFTTAFLIIYPSNKLILACKGDKAVATCLLFLAVKRELVSMFSAVSVWGKSYPTLTDKKLGGARISEEIFQRILSRQWINDAYRLKESIESVRDTEKRIFEIINPKFVCNGR